MAAGEIRLKIRGEAFMDEDLVELASSVIGLSRIVEGLVEAGPPPTAEQVTMVVGLLGGMRDRAKRIKDRRS